MYRHFRTVTIKNGISMFDAVRAAVMLAGHLNEAHGLQVKTGAEVFGALRVYWFTDMESLDAMPQLTAKLVHDKAYLELMEKIKPLVVEGSVQDRVVQLFP